MKMELEVVDKHFNMKLVINLIPLKDGNAIQFIKTCDKNHTFEIIIQLRDGDFITVILYSKSLYHSTLATGPRRLNDRLLLLFSGLHREKTTFIARPIPKAMGFIANRHALKTLPSLSRLGIWASHLSLST
jgi:hypothetical protein